MDGRIKSGHDGVVVAVEEQGEPGATRPFAMPPPLVMPGLDPGIHGRCMESRVSDLSSGAAAARRIRAGDLRAPAAGRRP